MWFETVISWECPTILKYSTAFGIYKERRQQGRGRMRECKSSNDESMRVCESESNCRVVNGKTYGASLSRDVISLRKRIKSFFTYCSINLRRQRLIILNNSIRIEISYICIVIIIALLRYINIIIDTSLVFCFNDRCSFMKCRWTSIDISFRLTASQQRHSTPCHSIGSLFREASWISRSICMFSHKNSIKHAIVKWLRASDREPDAILKLIARVGLLPRLHLRGTVHHCLAAWYRFSSFSTVLSAPTSPSSSPFLPFRKKNPKGDVETKKKQRSCDVCDDKESTAREITANLHRSSVIYIDLHYSPISLDFRL